AVERLINESILAVFFFFSSRRRHTRFSRDWSSDVCSSDLVVSDWFHDEVDAGIVMLWYESSMPGGQQVRVLGSPPLDLVELDGVVLTRRPLPSEPAEE